jgi:hypothetical protein
MHGYLIHYSAMNCDKWFFTPNCVKQSIWIQLFMAWSMNLHFGCIHAYDGAGYQRDVEMRQRCQVCAPEGAEGCQI